MSLEAIRRVAPSVFAAAPKSTLSADYTFIPTVQVVERMLSNGWQVMQAVQSKTRDVNRQGLQKHLLRFRHVDSRPILEGLYPEVVAINAHDGSSSYRVWSGCFRGICSNGLIACAADFGEYKVRHIGFDPNDVVDASFKVVSDIPKLQANIEAMVNTELTSGEAVAFAESAALVRWAEGKAPVEPRDLLIARRSADRRFDLFSVFNRVQENLIRGGVRGRAQTGRRLITRGIGSVSEDTRVNRALWALAESMRALKSDTAGMERITRA
jgi:hypothetical protein